MNYNEAIQYLNSLSKFGIKLGLGRIERLLNEMGNPQNQLKVIHIAGTNGKGSTAMMLANILRHSGYTTGTFISPYIICFRETIQIDGQMISESEFLECAQFVFDCAKRSTVDDENPTQFEIQTAIAFEWYKRRKCEYVCLEVGLGGRFDSTNVISPPIMQIITSISLDHTQILGDTIEEIAFEKAGIIKGGSTVVYPLQSEGALKVIASKCKEVNSKLVMPDLTHLDIGEGDWKKSEFIYEGIVYHKALFGEFQIYNAITTITAARQLRKMGVAITDDDIKQGIEKVAYPARMEVLSNEPFIILDGSHNPDGVKALEKVLKELSNYSITILMGVLADKNYSDMLDTLGKYIDEWIAVTPNNPRALSCKDLYEQIKRKHHNVCYYEDLTQAINYAMEKMNDKSLLVVCGSLYLAADIRPLILSRLEEKTHKEIKNVKC